MFFIQQVCFRTTKFIKFKQWWRKRGKRSEQLERESLTKPSLRSGLHIKKGSWLEAQVGTQSWQMLTQKLPRAHTCHHEHICNGASEVSFWTQTEHNFYQNPSSWPSLGHIQLTTTSGSFYLLNRISVCPLLTHHPPPCSFNLFPHLSPEPSLIPVYLMSYHFPLSPWSQSSF